jgi:hypothetical protein
LDLLAGAIAKHRQIERGRIAGAKTLAEGTGIFGMTPEAKSEANRKGGKIAGAANVAKGRGIFRMTEDGRMVREVAKEKKHAVSEREQNNTANRAAGYKPPKWATREASGSGS